MMLTLLLSSALLATAAVSAFGEISHQSFQGKAVRNVDLKYVLHLPEGYADPGNTTTYPLILFLHGAGERGNDLSKIANLGPLAYARAHKDFHFIVAAPQCPTGRAWNPDELIALLDGIEKKYRVNKSAVYLTGFSMGGAGTWATAMDYTHRFAAIAPLCGRAIPLLSGNLWRTPIWVFHGDKDDVVPFGQSREMVDILKGMGNEKLKFTVLEGEGHYIWDSVYSRSELYSWFMEHRKPSPEEAEK